MMKRQNYKEEYKQEMVKLYLSKNMKVVNFCEEQNLKRSTFFTWLSVYRKPNETLIDVTAPIKKANEIVNDDSKFSLSINNYYLEFSLKDLPHVLMVIKNG